MVKRRGRNFNLPRGSRFLVFGQHAPEKLDLFLAQLLLVLLGKVGSLFGQPRHHGIARQIFLIHPGQLRKHLKIPPIAFAERLKDAFVGLRTYPLVQLDESRPSCKQVIVVELEGSQENF